MKKRIPYSYVIFYLERKYYHLIEKELKEKGYENIKVIIPTLDILKRTVKGKMVFESLSSDNIELVINLIKHIFNGKSLFLITHHDSLPLSNTKILQVEKIKGLSYYKPL